VFSEKNATNKKFILRLTAQKTWRLVIISLNSCVYTEPLLGKN
jgi:hypothetical protein